MEYKTIRKSLKNNFLKNLIFRLDFSGMMDADVEDFIKSIRDKIHSRGYTTLQEIFENNTNVNLDSFDATNIQINNDTVKVYQFISPNNKILKISKSYIIFDINIELNETLFSDYLPLISEIITELKQREYVHYNRIGLRKLNTCIILDKSTLSDYFHQNVLWQFNENSITTQIADEIFQSVYRINYNRRFQEGIINIDKKETPAYQIILDIDASMQDDAENTLNTKVLENNASQILTELNDLIFEVYIKSLTEEYIEKLKDKNFDDNNILGVTKNVPNI